MTKTINYKSILSREGNWTGLTFWELFYAGRMTPAQAAIVAARIEFPDLDESFEMEAHIGQLLNRTQFADTAKGHLEKLWRGIHYGEK